MLQCRDHFCAVVPEMFLTNTIGDQPMQNSLPSLHLAIALARLALFPNVRQSIRFVLEA